MIISVISNWSKADSPKKRHGDETIESFGAWSVIPTKNLSLVNDDTKKVEYDHLTSQHFDLCTNYYLKSFKIKNWIVLEGFELPLLKISIKLVAFVLGLSTKTNLFIRDDLHHQKLFIAPFLPGPSLFRCSFLLGLDSGEITHNCFERRLPFLEITSAILGVMNELLSLPCCEVTI